MFKISKSDLKTKSKIQLQILFNQIALRIPALQNPELDLAQSALAMIEQELAYVANQSSSDSFRHRH